MCFNKDRLSLANHQNNSGIVDLLEGAMSGRSAAWVRKFAAFLGKTKCFVCATHQKNGIKRELRRKSLYEEETQQKNELCVCFLCIVYSGF